MRCLYCTLHTHLMLCSMNCLYIVLALQIIIREDNVRKKFLVRKQNTLLLSFTYSTIFAQWLPRSSKHVENIKNVLFVIKKLTAVILAFTRF